VKFVLEEENLLVLRCYTQLIGLWCTLSWSVYCSIQTEVCHLHLDLLQLLQLLDLENLEIVSNKKSDTMSLWQVLDNVDTLFSTFCSCIHWIKDWDTAPWICNLLIWENITFCVSQHRYIVERIKGWYSWVFDLNSFIMLVYLTHFIASRVITLIINHSMIYN